MCVALTLSRQGGTPTLAQLRDMADANPHGAGVAWLSKNTVKWRKGLRTAKDVHELLRSVPRPCLVHFRLASAGGNGQELTHPFPVRGDATLALKGSAHQVLIHNGHWSAYRIVCKVLSNIPTGAMSDTRLMAVLAARRGKRVLQWLGDEGQRIATLRADGLVTRYGTWSEVDGFHCSNTYWQRKYIVTSRAPEHRTVSNPYALPAHYRAAEDHGADNPRELVLGCDAGRFHRTTDAQLLAAMEDM